jgi:NAD(P)H-hydrate epimerase
MTGAALLVCRAAYRVGVGVVRLGIPKTLAPFVDVALPEMITLGVAETRDGTVAPKALAGVLALLQKSDVLAIGPGLTLNPQTQVFVRRLLERWTKPMVVDADGLNSLGVLGASILTPHTGEMARLMGVSVDEVLADREGIAKAAAKRFQSIVVLKGHQSLVTDGDQVYVNTTGNPGMATAGMGDVLTGVIAGLLAQGLSPWDAACTGVYVHGLAGDLAYQEKGVGLMASDGVENLPRALHL